jgi:hypothetical protein
MRSGTYASDAILNGAKRLKQTMGVSPNLMFSRSLSNALADPFRDEIVIGEPLAAYALSQGKAAFDLGVGFLVAHEFAHHFQFRMVSKRLQQLGASPQIELQADLLAGYYGGAILKEQWNNPLMERVSGATYIHAARTLGDYAFFSPTHHGTPNQRASATQIGFDAGQADKFGKLDDAFGENGRKVFDWSKGEVARVLTGG